LWKKLSSKNFPQAWPAAVSVCPGRGPEGNECGHVRFLGKKTACTSPIQKPFALSEGREKRVKAIGGKFSRFSVE